MRFVNSMLLIFVGLYSYGKTQTNQIEGVVLDDNKNGIIGAKVQLKDTKLGAITKINGGFKIDKVPIGNYILIVKAIGFELTEIPVILNENTIDNLRILLKETVKQGKEIQVNAKSIQQDKSNTFTSITKIEPRDAKYLPGAAEDVMRSLRALPGILSPSDFTSQLVVRGSGPDQNLIVLDDIEVFNPYRLYGFISMFNPETVTDITLLTGGFPAKYGDRLSAVLDVVNKEGDRDRTIEGTINSSLTNANLIIEGKIPFGLNGGWLFSTRRTYYDLIAGPILKSSKLLDGDVALPNFRDFQGKILIRPNSYNSIVINGLSSRDGTEISSGSGRERLDSISITDESFNTTLGVQWRFNPTEKLFNKTSFNWYENSGITEFGGSGGSEVLYGQGVTRDSAAKLIKSLPQSLQDSLKKRGIDGNNLPLLTLSGNAGFTFQKKSFNNETNLKLNDNLIEFGIGADLMRTFVEFKIERDSTFKALVSANGGGRAPSDVGNDLNYYRWHLYAQDKLPIIDNFYVNLGARFDYYKLINKSYVVPRLSASYAINDLTTLRAAFGIYYQSPGYEKQLDGQNFYDLSDPAVQNLDAEKSIHYVLGLDKTISDNLRFKIEAYYKKFYNLIIPKKVIGTKYIVDPIGKDSALNYASGWSKPRAEIGDSITSIPINGAIGEAKGIELFLQKISNGDDDRLNGWVSYSLAFTERIRDGVVIPFNFDQRHTINIVSNYKFNNWLEVGLNFQYGSGFPYTPAIGIKPRITSSIDSNGSKIPVIATNIFSESLLISDKGGIENINSARKNAYHRLDMRATFYRNWFGLNWALYLDIINVYNHSNMLSRNYFIDKKTAELKYRDVNMLPILPTIGINLKF